MKGHPSVHNEKITLPLASPIVFATMHPSVHTRTEISCLRIQLFFATMPLANIFKIPLNNYIVFISLQHLCQVKLFYIFIVACEFYCTYVS